MNAVFDINRFINLEKRNLINHKSQFLYASLILIGYFIFSVLLYLLIGFGQTMVSFIYPLCFIVIACAPSFFEKNLNKGNGTFELMLPGSTFEKFLVMFLNYLVLVPLACFGIVFLFVQLLGILPVEKLNLLSHGLSFAKAFEWKSLYQLFMVQSIFFAGYCFFNKYSFIKTLLTLIGFLIMLMIIFFISSAIIMSSSDGLNHMSENIMGAQFYFEEKIYAAVKIPSIIVGILMPWGLWIASFLKLREKEI